VRPFAIVTIVVIACLACTFAALSDIRGGDDVEPLPRVMIVADGDVIGVSTSAATVGDVLDSLRVTLDELDRCEPSLDTPVTDGMEIRVTRVVCRDVTEEVVLPSKTVVLADPDRQAGFTSILQRGEEGLLRKTWRVWEKDGEETLRGLATDETVREASDTVIVRGTRGVSNRGGDWRHPLIMEATAYDPGPKSCGKWASGYTATGIKAEKGVVAVDDRVIPMGTHLYIPGYGFALAADRGGAIKGMRIDLCFPTYREAKAFGRHKTKVYVLD
jgi:3D (Asp-Asp-Asp) domain-containing protein